MNWFNKTHDGRAYPKHSKTQNVMIRNMRARSKLNYNMSKHSSMMSMNVSK